MAQYYTVARPERVIKSICMSGGVSHSKAKNPMIKMMMVFLPEALFPNDKNIKKLLMKMCGTNYSVFLDNEAVFSHWGLLLKYFNNMHMSMHKIVKFTDEQIEILREKSLFIIGDKDRLVYEKDTVDTLNNLKVTYKIIEGAGHGINHEMSEDINKLIVEFFC